MQKIKQKLFMFFNFVLFHDLFGCGVIIITHKGEVWSYDMCGQDSSRLACSSAKSDQELHCRSTSNT